MKSMWVFIFGALINLGFLFVLVMSCLKSGNNNESWALPAITVLVAALLLAGLGARYFQRPGLANLLVMVVPALAVITSAPYVLAFVLPKGVGMKEILGILVAVLAIAGGMYFKAGSYKRVFDASRAQAARQKESQAAVHSERLHFSMDGRSGQVWYNGEGGRFCMYMELGGGDVLAVISVPGPDTWAQETGIGLGQREQVLHEIGAEAVRTQTKNGSYQLKWDSIFVYL